MKITSSVFVHDEPIPAKYTCKGPNVSPPLEFHDVPAEAKSLALIVEDMDSMNNWVHWLVYNIPTDVKGLEEGKLPEGAVDGVCNGGTHGYEGPCPKYFAGTHHYRFMLYALDIKLDIPHSADARVVLDNMENHILDSAILVGQADGEQIKVQQEAGNN